MKVMDSEPALWYHSVDLVELRNTKTELTMARPRIRSRDMKKTDQKNRTNLCTRISYDNSYSTCQ